jgi:hypothetical protein
MTGDTDFGKVAYDAYLHHVGYRSIHGEPLPEFPDQGPRIKNAWRLAAWAAITQWDAEQRTADEYAGTTEGTTP